ncbi:MAG: DUF4393 domain-containing protein [Paludibacteraceae bacterium]|nr:DUF4393 domain-containing protein [Paludibacteraceae bacterium]
MEDEKEIAKVALPELFKGGMQVVSQFYKDLAQPTIQTIGKTLNTTFEFATIPALALGFATEKVRLNFAKRLEEYKKKLDKVPEEDRCVVEPEIGEPIIRNLMNTTNNQIADLFTTLLTNASNIKTLDKAHPKFAQIVLNLTPDEAKIIQYLQDKDEVYYVDFRGKFEKGDGFYTWESYVTILPDEIKFDYSENCNAYISNLISLGILLDKSGTFKMNDTIYKKIESIHKPRLEKQLVPNMFTKITTKRSYLQVTDFGRLFIDACIS